MVLEDLNNYAECMIPIDDSNTINLKLFPTRPPPPPIYAHQVPVLTISLSTLSKPISSDLTLNRVLPCINGISSVSQIAQQADTDLSLTRKAIQHLVYYGCLVLLDIFTFGAIYAPTAEIGGFVSDEGVLGECARYVRMPQFSLGPRNDVRIGSESSRNRSDERASFSSTSSRLSKTPSSPSAAATGSSGIDFGPSFGEDTLDDNLEDREIPVERLIRLYTSLRQGVPLKTWVLDNLELLGGIDIRRLITFGVIKGFLYRVHRYAIATGAIGGGAAAAAAASMPPAPPTSLQSGGPSAATSLKAYGDGSGDMAALRQNSQQQSLRLQHKPSIASAAHAFAPHFSTPAGAASGLNVGASANLLPVHERRRSDISTTHLDGSGFVEGVDRERKGASGAAALSLVKFLDGMHCFDEICTAMTMPEKSVEAMVRGYGEVYVFSR